MANDFFRFKKFTVWHNLCAMKVGTDGVLLGAMASAENNTRILDIGTGSGLVALMLAQRFPKAHIDAIDIDEGAVKQATENVCKSIFADRIDVTLKDFRYIKHNLMKYDLIVSNPPFYDEDTSCPNKQRNTARHTTSLPFADLIKNASALLSENGVFTVVIPTQSTPSFIQECSSCGLFLTERTDIKTTSRKEARRSVLAFSSYRKEEKISTLMLRNEEGEWSEEYKFLTKDFYLNL